MADPLSFFVVNSNDSDSDNAASSEGDNDSIKASKFGSIADKKELKCEQTRLPPPMDVLAGAKRPEFTINCSQEDVYWDKLTKKASVAPEKEFKPWENKLPTVDQSVETKSGKTERTLAQQTPGASAPTKAEGPVQGRPQEYIDRAVVKDVPNHGPVWQGKKGPARRNGQEGFLYTESDAQKESRRPIQQLSGQRKQRNEHWAGRTDTKYLSRRENESYDNVSIATTNKHLLGCYS